MKLKTEPSSASSQPVPPVEENAGFIVSHERVPGRPLSEESRKELEALADLDDEDIDYSDIPPLSDEFFKNAVRGWLPLEMRSVSLALDAEVYEWVLREGKENARVINTILRREMQQAERHREQSPSEVSPAQAAMSKARQPNGAT